MCKQALKDIYLWFPYRCVISNYIPEHQQDYTRYRVAQAIDRLYQREAGIQPTLKKQHLQEKKILHRIRNKLNINQAMVTKADKGNAMVIIYQREYNKKALDFINNNNFATLNKDPTTVYQKEIRKIITNCTNVIPKNNTWKLINMNPSPPQFHGQTKVHKTNMPIRPVINWKQAPAYKLAQYLVHILNTHIPLPNAFNIKKLNTSNERPHTNTLQ
jgi:hypothetical protein